MIDAKAEARKAACEAVDHILPGEAAQYIGADFLADAAIDAYEAALEKAGLVLVPREITDAMWEAGAGLFPSLEEVEKGIHEQGEDIFYEVIPGPSEIWDAMIAAAEPK